MIVQSDVPSPCTIIFLPSSILCGRKIVVHGDGTSLWTITHSDDFAEGFAGLLGNHSTIGETYHITSDEALTWDQIHKTIGRALGVQPKIVHVPSEVISAIDPEYGPGLLGDKRYSLIFDNSKIKRAVPGFRAIIPFFRGMERSVAWLADHPKDKILDSDMDKRIDAILAKWETAKF